MAMAQRDKLYQALDTEAMLVVGINLLSFFFFYGIC